MLSARQIELFTLLVWGPIMAAGARSGFAWSEAVITVTLTASALTVARTYRGVARLAFSRR